jgi:hypothetical protein
MSFDAIQWVHQSSPCVTQIVNSGDAYLNVHNTPNPMGVVRGQVSGFMTVADQLSGMPAHVLRYHGCTCASVSRQQHHELLHVMTG